MLDSIAIFWDFDSLHDALMIDHYGEDRYRKFARKSQPNAIDIEAISSTLDQLGAPVLNRAYCNWLRMGRYGTDLQRQGIELIQLFPGKGEPSIGVNRAIIADINNYLHAADRASSIVLIGGGSEYLTIGKEVKQAGIRLIGLGISSEIEDLWIDTCDEFIHYFRMDTAPKAFERPTSDVDENEVRQTLIAAINQLSRHYGQSWVQQVKIKPAIVRISPNFDERDLGYESFSSFLRDQTDLLERRHRPGEQEPEYRLLDEFISEEDRAALEQRSQHHLVRHYLRVAGQQGIRMPDPVIMWEGIDVYASFLNDEVVFRKFADIDVECLRLLQLDFPDVTMTEVKKVRQVLFKCFLFSSAEDGVIGFEEHIKGIEDIEDIYFDLMLTRIGDNIDEPLDYEALSVALTGSPDQAERLKRVDTERREKV